MLELAQNYDSYKDFVADNPKLATLINYFKTEIQEICFPKNDYKESNYGYNHQQKLDNLKREFENAIHKVLQKDCYLTNKDEHAFIFVMDPDDPHLMPITLGRYYIPAVLLKYFNTDVKADLCTRYDRADVNALFNNFTTKEQIKNNIYVLPEDCRMITYSDIRRIPHCRIIIHELDPNLFKMLPKAVYRWLNEQTISIFYGIREEVLKRLQWHFNDSNYNPNRNLKTSTK